jgi:hypothetical protein
MGDGIFVFHNTDIPYDVIPYDIKYCTSGKLKGKANAHHRNVAVSFPRCSDHHLFQFWLA